MREEYYAWFSKGDDDWQRYAADIAEGRKRTVVAARSKAQMQVDELYPHAVYRERQDITHPAEQTYQQWLSRKITPTPEYVGYKRWRNQLEEQARLYVSTFVSAYQEELAAKDEAAKPKVQPQSQPTQPPAIPATSTTGATITVTQEEHTTDVHRYWLKIADPRHFDDAYEVPAALKIDFSDTTTSDTIPSTTSSFGVSAAGMPTSTRTPESKSSFSQSTSKTPQRRKPRISWE